MLALLAPRHNQRLDDPVSTDRFRQRFQLRRIKVRPWLIGVRLDGVDIDLEIRAAQLAVRQGGDQRSKAASETSSPRAWTNARALRRRSVRLIELRRGIPHQDHHFRSFDRR